jgi:hypothetical protein
MGAGGPAGVGEGVGLRRACAGMTLLQTRSNATSNAEHPTRECAPFLFVTLSFIIRRSMKSDATVSNPKKVPHLLLSQTSQRSLARIDVESEAGATKTPSSPVAEQKLRLSGRGIFSPTRRASPRSNRYSRRDSQGRNRWQVSRLHTPELFSA